MKPIVVWLGLLLATITSAAITTSRFTGPAIDVHSIDIDRARIRDLVGGFGNVGGARGVPLERSGRLVGVRLFGLRSWISRPLGLENGDVVRVANDRSLRSASALLEILARVDELDRVELVIERRGRTLMLTWRLCEATCAFDQRAVVFDPK